ncbi:MAG: DEAD/DEAH box helicase family protein, partial [Candidatus Babeliales bacterium]
MDNLFLLKSSYQPSGDQPKAIQELLTNRPGKSTLMGVTGSGKTFTIANVIARQSKPVLVLSPNKTLAAQLYEEFSGFFPHNKVCYFVSYYDYYQPESYVASRDVYIAKETKINSELERLRLEATASIVNRRDTIIIASVSCIYSLGNPRDYKEVAFKLSVGQPMTQQMLIALCAQVQYVRCEEEALPGTFMVTDNGIDINLAYQKDALRVELKDDRVAGLAWIHRQHKKVMRVLDDTIVFPAKHFVTPADRMKGAIERIREEVEVWAPQLTRPDYCERIRGRVAYDTALLEDVGHCSGIENYSVYFDGRGQGQPPYCLFDFFGEDFLLVIDESHLAIPQLKGMYAADYARKKSLVEFGFRLPSAYDNRPLMFSEMERYFKDVIFISATPGAYELSHSDHLVEQIIRPTGLVDPVVTV